MTGPFERALRSELIAAAERRSRRRGRIVAGVAGIGGALVFGLVSLLGPSPARADVEIKVEGGRVEVEIKDLLATPDEVRDAFVAAGLQAHIGGLPAGPSNVGRFVQVHVDGGGSQPVREGKESDYAFTGFSVPADWEGTLFIFLGEPADPGELYAVSSDAFAPGEPLHCTGLVGRPLVESLAELSGLKVRVQPIRDGALAPPMELADVDMAQYGGWHVEKGLAASSRDVILQLVDEPVETTAEEAEC